MNIKKYWFNICNKKKLTSVAIMSHKEVIVIYIFCIYKLQKDMQFEEIWQFSPGYQQACSVHESVVYKS